LVAALALVLSPGASRARGLAVEVWTDRGSDAVYEPGDRMQVKVRSSADAYMMVYEIDAEGYVHVLFPDRSGAGFLEGRHTYRLPPEDSDVELVVQNPVGQAYIVAIASVEPFDKLPWYLRPYNAQGEGVGYVGTPEGAPEEEEGVTAEGRIVGDPFVAMERIRRRVLKDAEDGETFSTAYTSYYVHQAVRYPRYVCYDCHRPGRWAWWDGFDPYYSSCSTFDLRVNWSWFWGPSYWYGHVPYFVYVYRPTCGPRYRSYYQQGIWYSSWEGWPRWSSLWGTGTLTRYKSPPPPGYTPPTKFGKWSPATPAPPGYLTENVRRGRAVSPFLPVGRGSEARGDEAGDARDPRWIGGLRKPAADRLPATGPVEEGRAERGRPWVAPPRVEPEPAMRPPREESRTPAVQAPREESTPRYVPRREERPTPPAPREEPRATPPRRESPPAPAVAPREERPKSDPPADKPRDPGSGRARRPRP
jgi:hypothetical protein